MVIAQAIKGWMDALMGWNKTIEWVINSDIGGATKWSATFTPQKQSNKAAQNNGVITNPDLNTYSPDIEYKQAPWDIQPGQAGASQKILDTGMLDTEWTKIKEEIVSISSPNSNAYIKDNKVATDVTSYLYPNQTDSLRSAVQWWMVSYAKPANSWVWINEDFILNQKEIGQALQYLNAGLPYISNTFAQQQITATLWALQEAKIIAKNKWDTAGYQDALAKQKIYLWQASKIVADWLYWSIASGKVSGDMETVMSALYDINNKWQLFQNFYSKSWSEIQQLRDDSSTSPTVLNETIYPASQESKLAKQELLSNVFYVNALNSLPDWAAKKQLLLDANSPTISKYEKEYLTQLQNNYIRPLYNQYKEIAGEYWYDYANKIYDTSIFDLLRVTSKTGMSDMIADVFSSTVFQMPTIYSGIGDRLSPYNHWMF